MDIVTKAMLAVLFHGTGADPDGDYTHPNVVKNYKYLKATTSKLVDAYNALEKENEKLKELLDCQIWK